MPLVACLDANVIVSAIAFGGVPLAVLDLALCRAFLLVLGPNIITTVRRILVGKLNLPRGAVEQMLTDVMEVASVFVPTGQLRPSVESGAGGRSLRRLRYFSHGRQTPSATTRLISWHGH